VWVLTMATSTAAAGEPAAGVVCRPPSRGGAWTGEGSWEAEVRRRSRRSPGPWEGWARVSGGDAATAAGAPPGPDWLSRLGKGAARPSRESSRCRICCNTSDGGDGTPWAGDAEAGPAPLPIPAVGTGSGPTGKGSADWGWRWSWDTTEGAAWTWGEGGSGIRRRKNIIKRLPNG